MRRALRLAARLTTSAAFGIALFCATVLTTGAYFPNALLAVNNLADIADIYAALTNLKGQPLTFTNVTLSSLSSTNYTTVRRFSYLTMGDSSPLDFTSTNSACTTAASITASASSGDMNVTAIGSGQLRPGLVVQPGVVISAQTSGTTSSTGHYTLSSSVSFSSTTVVIAGDGGSQVSSSDGKCWQAQFGTGPVDATAWGAKCDGSSDDTAAITAWVVQVNISGRGSIPAGTCRTSGGHVISKPIKMAGRGRASSIISLLPGSTQPVFTVSVVGSVPGGYAGTFPAQVEFDGFKITSPDRTDAAGLGLAHSIRLLDANPPVTRSVNAITPNGNATLHFGSVPATILPGQYIGDNTSGGVIPAKTTVLSTTSTTVTMSAAATGGGVGASDSITFTTLANIKVTFRDMQLAETPGDCIHAGAGEFLPGSWVELYGTDCTLPGGYGLYANSVSDWNMHGGQIYGAKQANILLAGCINMGFHSVNEYNSEGDAGVDIFHCDTVRFDGNSYIDIAYKHTMRVNNLAGQRIDIVDSTIRCGSFGTTATYSDLDMGAANGGNVYLINSNFPTPASCGVFGGGVPVRNVTIEGGGSPDGKLYMVNSKFGLGNFLTAGVTNAPSLIYPDDEASDWSPTIIGSGGGSATHTLINGTVTYRNGWVTALGTVASSSISGLVDDLQVGNLPIAAQNADASDVGYCLVIPYIGRTAASGYTNLFGIVPAGGTIIQLYETRSDGTLGRSSPVSEWVDVSRVGVVCHYHY